MTAPVCDNQKGYVILYAVIILAAVILAIVIYSVNLATFSAKSAATLRKSNQARYLADTCSETALQLIWDENNYTGSGNLSLYGGDCTYQVTNAGGDNREIRATGTVGNITRKVKNLIVVTGGLISTPSWREVADF